MHFHIGIYEKESKIYCGIVNKQAGTIRMLEGDKLATQNGPPIQIRHVSSTGEFVALLQPSDIQKWMEEKGDTGLSPKWMKTLKEDDNPVVVILQ